MSSSLLLSVMLSFGGSSSGDGGSCCSLVLFQAGPVRSAGKEVLGLIAGEGGREGGKGTALPAGEFGFVAVLDLGGKLSGSGATADAELVEGLGGGR